ncbi:MAG: alpha-ketoglutarate-dependent dioxygenase AlkB [Actinobacteria bacterium]|nr:alpha-ketoglutarate-dependent dioxygenase AlkB [Actinomycetota bacterium]
MSGVEGLSWQSSLLDAAEPEFDGSFAALVRHQLDPTAWVDHVPGWVTGPETLFAELLAGAPWEGRDRHMYGQVVAQPRLTAWWDAAQGGVPFSPVIDQMRYALSARYHVELDSVGLNLYRSGHDSVAWHGDRIARHVVDPVVAIVSLGEARRFLLRPRSGGGSRRFLPRAGDLLVMGGACQRTWQHCVPKVASAGPRISVTFRHSA